MSTRPLATAPTIGNDSEVTDTEATPESEEVSVTSESLPIVRGAVASGLVDIDAHRPVDRRVALPMGSWPRPRHGGVDVAAQPGPRAGRGLDRTKLPMCGSRIRTE